MDRELLKKLRRIEIVTGRRVNSTFAGEYQSAFKGKGMEFEEVRLYQPGDDIRDIDWNVTARSGEPHIKRFREERELTVFLLVDFSESGLFGSGEKSKRECAAELAAVLAFSAIRNNDRVGLIGYTDRVELFVPAAKGARHALRIIREVLGHEPQGKGTSLNCALEYLGKVQHKTSVVFMISDFYDRDYEKRLSPLALKHDMTALMLTDRRERELPRAGLISLIERETGRRRIVDSGSEKVRRQWAAKTRERLDELTRTMARRGIPLVNLDSSGDWVKELSLYFLTKQTGGA
ncbi:MAG: DUF58 domain-containing protein [Spirochaetales bacterium]|nr:DUF58 domain-containing protein [Spirochaetales bacterium]